ncbi:MAG: hypothetical protein AAF597_15220 [Bacteroidota bacterium]
MNSDKDTPKKEPTCSVLSVLISLIALFIALGAKSSGDGSGPSVGMEADLFAALIVVAGPLVAGFLGLIAIAKEEKPAWLPALTFGSALGAFICGILFIH